LFHKPNFPLAIIEAKDNPKIEGRVTTAAALSSYEECLETSKASQYAMVEHNRRDLKQSLQ